MKLDAHTPEHDLNACAGRRPAVRREHAGRRFGSVRQLLAGVLLVAALLAACGGDDTVGSGSAMTPPVETTDTGTPTAEHPATPADPPVDSTELPAALAEPPATPVEPDDESPASSAPEPEIEPESDAGRWVDQRQDSVTDNAYDNHMDAVEVWSP